MHDSGKETNPKDIIGMKKVPISTLSGPVLFEMGLGMLEGARKYGRHNYRAMGVSATVYFDAAVGHLIDWFEGEDIDSDSGLSHVTKAMTALLVLRDSMLMGNWIDDRPLRNPNKLYKKSFNPKAKEIIEKYPDCVAPFLEKDKKFVCPAGWEIKFRDGRNNDCGWWVYGDEGYLRKGLIIRDGTGHEPYHKFGEAPGFWPTKEAAENALQQYLGKANYCEHCEEKIRRAANGNAVGLCRECSKL